MAPAAASALIVAAPQDGRPADAPAPLGWRLRSDVQFAFDQATTRYQVRSPESGERFELGEEEVFLCQRLSLEASLTAIQTAFNARFGLAITESELEQFYQEMAGLGLLESSDLAPSDEAPNVATDPSADRVELDEDDQPGVPYRWALLNPHQRLSALARKLAWLRHGVWLLIPGVPLALLILIFNQPQYQFALKAIADPGLHLLFKLVFGLFVINLLSKLAQGLSCVYCGGRAEQFGIRLAYGLIPRFFVSKRLQGLGRESRLWVAGSALLVKLALFVVGIVLWRLLLGSSGALSSYSFVVGHMALGAFLFTANPLWRADGYIWLAHFLRMPRLRERAFQVLGLYWRGRRPPAGLPSSEKYSLLGYAVASIAFIVIVVALVLLGLAIRLELRFQGLGVLLFLLVAVIAGRWLLVRLARRRERGAKGLAPAPVPSLAAAAGTTTTLPAKQPSSIMPVGTDSKRWRGWRLLLVVLLIGLSWLPYPYDVTGEVTLFPAAQAQIHAVTPGVVERVLASENQRVTPEQVLAELSTWQQDSDIAVTRAEIERKQAEIQLLQQGPKTEAIEASRQQLEMAKVRASHSQKVQDLLTPVFKSGVVKGLEYETAVKTAEVDKAAVAVAGAELALLKSPPLPTEVAVKHAELRQLREQLRYLESRRDRSRLQAPVEGRVVTPRLEFKTGAFLKEGDLFAVVEDNRVMQAEILTPETDIGEVRLDMPVRLRVWAYPLRDFTGRVTAIAPTVESKQDNPFLRVIRIKIEIPNPDGVLKSQMTGFAKITADEKPFIVAFTRALVRFVMLEMWSWLP